MAKNIFETLQTKIKQASLLMASIVPFCASSVYAQPGIHSLVESNGVMVRPTNGITSPYILLTQHTKEPHVFGVTNPTSAETVSVAYAPNPRFQLAFDPTASQIVGVMSTNDSMKNNSSGAYVQTQMNNTLVLYQPANNISVSFLFNREKKIIQNMSWNNLEDCVSVLDTSQLKEYVFDTDFVKPNILDHATSSYKGFAQIQQFNAWMTSVGNGWLYDAGSERFLYPVDSWIYSIATKPTATQASQGWQYVNPAEFGSFIYSFNNNEWLYALTLDEIYHPSTGDRVQ